MKYPTRKLVFHSAHQIRNFSVAYNSAFGAKNTRLYKPPRPRTLLKRHISYEIKSRSTKRTF